MAWGDATLKNYAKTSYGIELTDDEVGRLSETWFELFPEMRRFLGKPPDSRLATARFFGLTLASHGEWTGSRRFLNHAGDDDVSKPSIVLGGMCLKVLRTPNAETQTGKPYHDSDIDYFWSKTAERLRDLPEELQCAVAQRQPSLRLQRGVLDRVGLRGVFTLTGRLRAKASYCARRNTVFQGLAADGAKLALWRLWRAGHRIVNFVHDEVLVEVPNDSEATHHAEQIRRLMIEGMKSVVPGVRVEVRHTVRPQW